MRWKHALAMAALFMYAVRLRESRLRRFFGRVAGMGYATPGAVIAVGVLVVFGTLDRLAPPFLPLVSGTLFVIGFAYMLRFFAIPLQLSRAGLERIGKPLEEASRLLGHPPLRTFLQVDLPLLRAPLAAAGMLLFVDILKELPLTLILRPANFETLATTAYSLASEARLHACAVPALLIVAVGAVALTGHQLITTAHRYAPASILAPFGYSQIIFMTASSWLIFNEPPDIWVFVGAPIVIGSGLYIWLRERQLSRTVVTDVTLG